jgi:hypothetical protein
MCGGGGGGGAPIAKAVKAATKKTPTVSKSAPSKSGASAAPASPKSFFDSGSSAGETQTNTGQGQSSAPQAQQYISQDRTGGDVSDRSAKKFIPGAGEGGRESVGDALGGLDLTVMTGQSPFRGYRRQFLEKDFKANPEVPGGDAIVEDQANVEGMVSASAEGDGAQGFGQRALAGDEAAIVATDATQSNANETGLPAEMAQSDLQMDPNYVTPSPGKIYVGDQEYNLPTIGQSLSAFTPNSRDAAMRAAGPISRGLMSMRSGFGRRFF